jgi:hypothetical protein
MSRQNCRETSILNETCGRDEENTLAKVESCELYLSWSFINLKLFY